MRHEEVNSFGERAVSSQGRGADPHAVVSGLHEGEFGAVGFQVSGPGHTEGLFLHKKRRKNEE